MSNGSITVRLAEKDIEGIDRLVSQGRFTSRSDLVRTAVRRIVDPDEELLRMIEENGRRADAEGLTIEDIVKEVRKVRKELYEEMYGDDDDE